MDGGASMIGLFAVSGGIVVGALLVYFLTRGSKSRD